jgi:hypothetical protein
MYSACVMSVPLPNRPPRGGRVTRAESIGGGIRDGAVVMTDRVGPGAAAGEFGGAAEGDSAG